MGHRINASSVTRVAASAAVVSVIQLLRVFAILAALAAPTAFAQDFGNTLKTNQSLLVNQYLTSPNKIYKLVMQGDGNLALYRSGAYIWGTGATAGRRAVMQGDGNLCMVNPAGAGVWCNSSNGAVADYYLMLRDSGDLEVYRGRPEASGASVLVWTTLLDAGYYNNRYADLKAAFNGDARRLMEHWVIFGRYEGRSPKTGVSDEARNRAKAMVPYLETMYYANKYVDLKNAFGYDPVALAQHWLDFGIKEARIPNPATEAWLAPAPRSANGQSSMRMEDWLHTNEYLQSPNGQYRAVLQGDYNVVINQNGQHRWNYFNNVAWPQPYGPAVLRVQGDGHFCVYKGSVNAQGQGIKCLPAGAGGPIGRYYLTLQDDGNLVVYKGNGPADSRGWIWDRITTAPSSPSVLSALAESVKTFVVNTANTTASGATAAANTVAAGTTAAANDFAREVSAGAKVAINATVNTANLVADTSENVAVTVGRTVENGAQVVGTEIVKNGQVVGYAVANLAVDAWNMLNTSCGAIGRKVFPIDRYFQGARQITGAINTYSGFVPGSADLKRAADQANQCFEWVQDGFYCAFPAEVSKFAGQAASMPGNIINLSTRVFNEAKTEECLIAGAATVTMGGAGLPVCALGKVVVTDAQKAFACFSAAEALGVMKKFFTPEAVAGEKANPTRFPNQASCNGIGELAFDVGLKLATRGMTAEAKAAQAAGKSNSVAMVAEQLRQVYKIAARGAKYDDIVRELDTLPECK